MIEVDASYQILEGVFSAAEMLEVLDQLSGATLDRSKAGARHLLRLPVIRELANDPRMLSLARQFVGEGAAPFRATLFDKSPDANWMVPWHQDTALPMRDQFAGKEWGPWSKKAGVLYAHAPAWALEQVIALRVSLDDSSKENGPLRILPDTHRLGVLTDAEINVLARERKAQDCIASRTTYGLADRRICCLLRFPHGTSRCKVRVLGGSGGIRRSDTRIRTSHRSDGVSVGLARH